MKPNHGEIQPTLAGLVVGVPAARRAEETAALVRRWGGVPLVGPALQEVPIEDEQPLRDATADVIASRPEWSVHLTGVGTRRWMERAQAWGLLESLRETLRDSCLVARGPKAAAALRSYDLQASWMPDDETSREIAAWLGPQVRPGHAVVIQRHGEPVPALEKALEAAGARVIEAAAYHWDLPADRGPAERLVTALVSGEVHTLVVTSAPQARHLFLLARGLGIETELRRALSERVFVGAVGAVAGRGLTQEGVEADLVAEPARLGALIRALAASRELVIEKVEAAPTADRQRGSGG